MESTDTAAAGAWQALPDGDASIVFQGLSPFWSLPECDTLDFLLGASVIAYGVYGMYNVPKALKGAVQRRYKAPPARAVDGHTMEPSAIPKEAWYLDLMYW